MLLRNQLERHAKSIDLSDYNEKYGMNTKRAKQMKNGAIIMHPAPFNRNIEITDDLVEGNNYRIFKQMENGVYIRMAVIYNAIK